MSRKGDCLDNAPMESFFHTLKTELVHHRKYATRADAQRDLLASLKGSTIECVSTRQSDTSARPRWNAKRLNPVH